MVVSDSFLISLIFCSGYPDPALHMKKIGCLQGHKFAGNEVYGPGAPKALLLVGLYYHLRDSSD